MADPICSEDAPRAASDLTKSSIETDLSAFSILATRDWLERIFFANSCCVRCCSVRRDFSFAASAIFIVITVSSASLNLMKSDVDPTIHPAFTNFFCFVAFIL